MTWRSKARTLLLISGAAMLTLLPPVAHARSPADCAAQADYVARSSGTMVGGAARGAVRGAAFGAIVGDRKSARRGAALGAVVGGARRANERNYIYSRAYEDCMRGY